jgi:hypothetical protein
VAVEPVERIAADVRPAVDHEHCFSGLGQVAGSHSAGKPGPNDQHIHRAVLFRFSEGGSLKTASCGHCPEKAHGTGHLRRLRPGSRWCSTAPM